MRGSSRGATTAAQQVLDSTLAGGADGASLADDLFAATAIIDGNASLRRALADSSRDGDAKRSLAVGLFGGKVSASAAEVLGDVASQRWAAERDFSDTLESFAVQSLLAKAENEGRIDRVEEELFRFERIVAADPELRDTLSPRNTDGAGKSGVVDTLLNGKAAPETIRLVEQAVTTPRGRRLDQVLEDYLKLAGTRRNELTALVTAAHPLDEQQQARLRTALEGMYGKKVTLHIVLDPSVVGGIRVQIGDEVVDGTVSRKLSEVRRDLTGS